MTITAYTCMYVSIVNLKSRNSQSLKYIRMHRTYKCTYSLYIAYVSISKKQNCSHVGSRTKFILYYK